MNSKFLRRCCCVISKVWIAANHQMGIGRNGGGGRGHWPRTKCAGFIRVMRSPHAFSPFEITLLKHFHVCILRIWKLKLLEEFKLSMFQRLICLFDDNWELIKSCLILSFQWIIVEMVFCYQNCSDLLWEKIVLVIEKNFWNSRLQAKNLQKNWDH